MFTRVLTWTGAKNIDDGVAFARDQVVPVAQQQKGYRGLSISVDRDGGVVGVLSLWETEADREASLAALAEFRQKGSDIIGGELTVDNFEQVVEEMASPPGPGAPLSITRISMDPANIDDNAAFFKSEVLPRIKASPGFKGLRSMIDRKTGKGLVGSVWADADSLKNALAEGKARRQEGEARGVSFEGDSVREIVFTDLK